MNTGKKAMAVLAGFRNVIDGAEYGGVKIARIQVDTRGHFHLIPKKDDPLSYPFLNEAVAVLDSRTHAEPNLDNKDVFWLWENMESAVGQG